MAEQFFCEHLAYNFLQAAKMTGYYSMVSAARDMGEGVRLMVGEDDLRDTLRRPCSSVIVHVPADLVDTSEYASMLNMAYHLRQRAN